LKSEAEGDDEDEDEEAEQKAEADEAPTLGGFHPYIRPEPHKNWVFFIFHPYIP